METAVGGRGRVVLTYGTFDLLHVGHLNLLERLKALGDCLVVGVSTDEFNAGKGKRTIIPFHDRLRLVQSMKCVDLAIPESSWEQKVADIRHYGVSVFGMGGDWQGKFDDLKQYCEVVYLSRTEDISSTHLKQALRVLGKEHMGELRQALGIISSIVDQFE
jgi:glycerol-3-phosphate cytidylyltransferase